DRRLERALEPARPSADRRHGARVGRDLVVCRVRHGDELAARRVADDERVGFGDEGLVAAADEDEERTFIAYTSGMRVLLVGAWGTIGRAVRAALQGEHEVLGVGHRGGELTVDLADPSSIRDLLREAGTVDAIVCAAGLAKFAPLARLSDRDFEFSLANKLMG